MHYVLSVCLKTPVRVMRTIIVQAVAKEQCTLLNWLIKVDFARYAHIL